MFSVSKKPYSAVTVHINRFCDVSISHNQDLCDIVELIEVITLQTSGPFEAARAIRKQLKRGTTSHQLRALKLLDNLLENAGPKLSAVFSDELLLDRLKLLIHDMTVDHKVQKKTLQLLRKWNFLYISVPELDRISSIYRLLPNSHKLTSPQRSISLKSSSVLVGPTSSRKTSLEKPPQTSPDTSYNLSQSPLSSQFKLNGPTNPANSFPSSVPSSKPHRLFGSALNAASLSFGKQGKTNHTHCHSTLHLNSQLNQRKKSLNLNKEKSHLLEVIASASVASVNLQNSLQLVNRQLEKVQDNSEIRKHLLECQTLRQTILHYIQVVDSEEYIGGLLRANDELVLALQSYQILEKSVEDDDSDTPSYQEARAEFIPHEAMKRLRLVNKLKFSHPGDQEALSYNNRLPNFTSITASSSSSSSPLPGKKYSLKSASTTQSPNSFYLSSPYTDQTDYPNSAVLFKPESKYIDKLSESADGDEFNPFSDNNAV